MAEITLPQNLEAERALLGSILLNNSALAQALDHLAPEDFFSSAHREFYARACELSDAGREIDLVTLSDVIPSDVLEKSGGSAYLASLTDGVPTTGNISDYVRIVKEKANLRRLVTIAGDITRRACGETDSARELAEYIFEQLAEITLGDSPANLHSFYESALDLIAELDRGPLPKILTGIEAVDQLTGGFLPGELVLISAETTGSGKTLFAQQIRRIACAGGMHGIYFSTEMLHERISAREIIARSQVPGWKFRQPDRLTPDERAEIGRLAVGECRNCYILDGVMSMGRIVATTRRIHGRTPLHLAVIDYDELVVSPGRNEIEQLAAVAQAAHRLAVGMKLVVILISQVRKVGGDRANAPILDKFYGSSAKIKYASCAIIIERPYVKNLKGDEKKVTLWIAKSRDSRAGPVDANFDVHRLYFTERAPDADASQPSEANWYEKEG